ncbi:hypothetical protein PRNP1_000110 [Phytophthora ramorum]
MSTTEMRSEGEHHDEAFPLLDADKDELPGESTALLEDKMPNVLFHEDAIADTDSEHEDDEVSTDGSVIFDEAMCKSAGRVGSKEKWGHEPLAVDYKMLSVGIEMSEGLLVKVEGCYLPDEETKDEMQSFELQQDEAILKVFLFRVRREIHAIQFVTNQRTSDRFGGTKRGELCKAVEAPEGAFIAGFFGDVSRGEEDIDLGVRFADRPVGQKSIEEGAEVAEIDQVK